MKRLFIAAAGVPLILAACSVTDPVYETPHPDHGRIIVSADWNGIGQGITAPSEYTLVVNGETYIVTSDTHTLPGLFEPGSYSLYLYNNADGIVMDGSVASVAASGLAYDGVIGNLPGWFFSFAAEVTVESDRVHEFTIAMRQQVRELTLVIEPTGGIPERIESIAATLSGVAGTLDINGEVHGSPSSVTLPFVRATAGELAGKWIATVRLLGTAGAEQTLTGTVSFANGTPDPLQISCNLSGLLDGFNSDKATPLPLGSRIVETPTGTDITATITDWSRMPDGTGIAY